MSINMKYPQIIMKLYETDIYELEKFIARERVEEEFKEEYFILYNFASDCRYAVQIQQVKYSFFKYLSILLFNESDNLFAMNETREFWTSGIWDFDDGYFTREFSWNDDVVGFFEKMVNRKRIETLFEEVKLVLLNLHGSEFTYILYEEMNQSFESGIFDSRKAEFLKKINSPSDYTYWDPAF